MLWGKKNCDIYTGPWRLFAKSIPFTFHLSILGIQAFDALSLSIPFSHDELLACLLFGGHPLKVHERSVGRKKEKTQNRREKRTKNCGKLQRVESFLLIFMESTSMTMREHKCKYYKYGILSGDDKETYRTYTIFDSKIVKN